MVLRSIRSHRYDLEYTDSAIDLLHTDSLTSDGISIQVSKERVTSSGISISANRPDGIEDVEEAPPPAVGVEAAAGLSHRSMTDPTEPPPPLGLGCPRGGAGATMPLAVGGVAGPDAPVFVVDLASSGGGGGGCCFCGVGVSERRPPPPPTPAST